MKIGVTLGDPAGIGPEIILKSLPKLKNLKGILIFGNNRILRKTAQDLNLAKNYKNIKDNIVDCVSPIKFEYGKPTKETGQAAIASIDNALKANLDIIITPPIVKQVIRDIIPDFIGHTEYFAKYFGVKKFGMVGLLKNKRVMLLTTHLPLRDVFKKITPLAVSQKIIFLNWGLSNYFGLEKPSIGVAALNPHAFEFSRGEDEKIKQGITIAEDKGIKVSGPYPADSLFNRPFDGFLAMFHDQAFVYLKSKKGGLNWTLGLPVIRLSPLYGAALDIAGKNCADFSGMIVAVREGIRIYKKRKKYCVERVIVKGDKNEKRKP